LGLEQPIGQILTWGSQYSGPIVGVARDFNFASLHHEVEPLVIPLRPGVGNMLLVRARVGSIPDVLMFLEEEIGELAPNTLFKYTFVGDEIDLLYRAEDQLSKVFGYFSLIAILIACLGLFGLAAYSAEQRSKEIGIRKVLGASVPNIFVLLSKDFARLVVLAFLVATPVSFYAMNRWLQAFAYRIELDMWYFLFGGAVALGIALLTVSYQAIKASVLNPVDALRYE
jgi:putative ABC transport system permease protein